MASLPYPRCQILWENSAPNYLCRSVPSVGEKIFPQNAHTEPSGREESPTDEHGCSQIRRVWHPCHTHAAKFCGRTAHLTICVDPCHPWEKRYSRRTHTRNLLAEKSLPQMSTDVHRLGGYGRDAIPTLPNSVGEQRPPTICANPYHPWEELQLFGAAETAAPPDGVSVPFVEGSLSNRLPCLRRVL